MDQALVFFLASVLIVGALVLAWITKSKKGSRKLDVDFYRSKCLEIEHQLRQDEPSSYHLCILNADKLMDRAMRAKGIKGKTVGERLRSASNIFTDLNGVWQAHKLRNQIAHEYDLKISYKDAKYALRCFRQALKDLGAI